MRRYFEGVLTCTIQHSVACRILSERRVCGPTYQKHVNGNTYMKLLRGKTRVPHFRFVQFHPVVCRVGRSVLGNFRSAWWKKAFLKFPCSNFVNEKIIKPAHLILFLHSFIMLCHLHSVSLFLKKFINSWIAFGCGYCGLQCRPCRLHCSLQPSRGNADFHNPVVKYTLDMSLS